MNSIKDAARTLQKAGVPRDSLMFKSLGELDTSLKKSKTPIQDAKVYARWRVKEGGLFTSSPKIRPIAIKALSKIATSLPLRRTPRRAKPAPGRTR